MDFTKQLNQISKIINNIPYENAYIEIEVDGDKYILEKHKKTTSAMGFRVGGNNE